MKTEPFQTPIQLFDQCYQEAVSRIQDQADVMVLATASPDAVPSARVVLFRGWIEGGLSFYTNYLSRKGDEIQANPRGSLVFYWNATGRQIRIEGSIRKLSGEQSDVYWRTRPRGSQLSGSVSKQSQKVASLEPLQRQIEELDRKHEGRPVPRPAHWGGYILIPHYFEFWRLGDFRLHERVSYTLVDDHWEKHYLAP